MPIKTATANNFTNTMTVLKLADSLIPTTRITVTSSMPTKATTLKMPVECGSALMAVSDMPASTGEVKSSHLSWNHTRSVPGVLVYRADKLMPKSESKAATVPDHPEPTVAAPNAYSSMRSQPMIHANISPNVEYPYV